MKIPIDAIVDSEDAYRSPEEFTEWLGPVDPARGSLETIGRSREGRAIVGLRLGRGRRRLSLLGGAHADEPVGPIALLALCRWLSSSKAAEPVLDQATLSICPHINPDGAHRNAGWAAKPDFRPEDYVLGTVREPPGDDVEFGYPIDPDTPARPENRAVADFLRQGGPYDFHASLHGMAIAEGAWYLICREEVDRTRELRRDLAAVTRALGLALHDWDRRGEKGFWRIEPGFSTTPTSTAMKEYFLDLGEPEEAEKFLPSSMEFVRSLGGRPLAMVSEIPLFRVRPTPPECPVPGRNFLEAGKELSAAALELAAGRPKAFGELLERFEIEKVPWKTAMKLQLAMVFLGSGLSTIEELEAAP